MDRLEQIKTRLHNTSPGPWSRQTDAILDSGGNLIAVLNTRSGSNWVDNAVFLLEVRDDLHWLFSAYGDVASKNEGLTARVAELESAVSELNSFDAPAELVTARKRIAELEEFSADVRRYWEDGRDHEMNELLGTFQAPGQGTSRE